MKARCNKKSIVFSGIYDESLLCEIGYISEKSGCKIKLEDYSTKAIVKGTKEQLNKFVNLWNK